jgi:hypothetical protein
MLSRTIRAFMLIAVSASCAAAQMADDESMAPKKALIAGVFYAHDSWDQYWEGMLKRSNGNIGTLTTQSVTSVVGYGVAERFSVMAALPYVWTQASQGTLRGLSGVQDLTLTAKYKLLTTKPSEHGAFSAFLEGTAAIPMSSYTPDFLPLSIGTGDGRAAGHLILNYQSSAAWFVNASTAYTWCSNVRLNRDSYYTNGSLYMTNQVAMPNVMDDALTAGVNRGRWRIPLTFAVQRTLGGGDIRRQDMPFVSNRMDFAKLDGSVMYTLSVPKDVSLRIGAAHVLSGRNVGQSTTLTTGVLYAFHF